MDVYLLSVILICPLLVYLKLSSPTQSSPVPVTVPLWSHCRSRSLSLMLSVNEGACIVPGAMKRGTWCPHWAAGLFFSGLAFFIFFTKPCNPVRSGSLGQRREGRGWAVHRKTQSGSGLCFYCNLCKYYALLFSSSHLISDCSVTGFFFISWPFTLLI